MSSKDTEVTIDLTGTHVRIDGEERLITGGELVAQVEYLFGAEDAVEPSIPISRFTLDIQTTDVKVDSDEPPLKEFGGNADE